MPIIAGMSPAYFKKQIEAYAAGKRPSPEMEPYAKMVVVLGVDDVARYFAEQKMEADAHRLVSRRGRARACRGGAVHDLSRARGQGRRRQADSEPGRSAPGYLRDQMLLFKQDKRNPGDATLNAVKALMRIISDETYADLAAYYSSLR